MDVFDGEIRIDLLNKTDSEFETIMKEIVVSNKLVPVTLLNMRLEGDYAYISNLSPL
jgi:hypothetical protein